MLPGAVKRMVNRMIKPRSPFFAQMPKDDGPLPTTAAWPAIVSGAPGGAGREMGGAAGFHPGSTPKELLSPTAGGGGTVFRGSPARLGLLHSPGKEAAKEAELRRRGAVSLSAAVTTSAGGAAKVTWCAKLADVREYCENEQEMVRRSSGWPSALTVCGY